jgi:hypothetical protein
VVRRAGESWRDAADASLKVERALVAERYRAIIDSLYE